MVYYVVTISMRFAMPNADPIVIEDERAPLGVLEYLRDEIERFADQDFEIGEDERAVTGINAAYDALLAEVEDDREHAAKFDTSPGSGFRYDLPDGNILEATAYTREQLLELGYVPGEDFES